MTDHEKTRNAARLLEQLQRNQALHTRSAVGLERELSLLRRWQSARLARTYADLLQNARYRPAAEFFLDELYGNGDLGQRDRGEHCLQLARAFQCPAGLGCRPLVCQSGAARRPRGIAVATGGRSRDDRCHRAGDVLIRKALRPK